MKIPTLSFEFYGNTETLTPNFGRYSNGRLAITFVDAETGEPFGTATVNMPAAGLANNEVIIKHYSENEALYAALVENGWIKLTDRVFHSGYVSMPICTMAGPLVKFAAEMGNANTLSA